jgi:arabinan endo-1,5-alpha-L-arabinosidase
VSSTPPARCSGSPRASAHDLEFEGNSHGCERYAIGYATAESVTGPYTKGEEPLFTTDASDGRFIGPGGQDVVVAPDGSDGLAFHSWYGGLTYRAMNPVDLEWQDGRPVVGTTTP